MNRIARFRPTPALVIASIALLVALGGTSAAAVALVPKNSVGSDQVINGSLKSKDFKEGVLPQSTDAFTRSIAGPVALQFKKTSGGRALVATLTIPKPGTYLIWAKARFAADSAELRCDLTAGERSDTSGASLAKAVGPLAAITATLSHLMVQKFDEPGNVDLQCTNAVTGNVVASDVTLVAMGIADSTNS
jgi:hypothetical protein